jgi:hypothetical protein
MEKPHPHTQPDVRRPTQPIAPGDVSSQRDRLSQVIGRLLARHWLRRQQRHAEQCPADEKPVAAP